MVMQLVYRIEHLTKKTRLGHFAGPYGHSGVCHASEWIENLAKHEARPIPQSDELLIPFCLDWSNESVQQKYLCGFISLDQLRDWFSNWERHKLRELGFAVVSYHSETVLEGTGQCVFEPIIASRIVLDGGQ